MKQKKSLGTNAIVSGLRQVISLAFPLITYPYISRVLQVDNLGKFVFAQSVISYFQLFSALGIATYAVREGAKFRESRNDISSFASEIFTINVISTILSYLTLFLIVFTNPKLYEYNQILLLLSISMFFTTIGCEWVYTIFEEYLYIAKRTIVFQIISLIMMFTLVRSKEDVLWYAFITVLSSSGANIINLLLLKNYCSIRFCFNKNVLVHLLPLLIIFANSVTVTIYVSSGTTILGFLTSDFHVGIYSIAGKIYSTVKQILASIILVSIPRLSFLWGQNRKKDFDILANNIFNTLITVIFPIVIGLYCLSKDIIIVLSSNSFISATGPLRILSFTLIVCLLSWFFTSCILIPCKKERFVLYATCVAALVNLIFNLLLIPLYKEKAAAFATFFAEFSSFLICYYYSRDLVKISIRRSDVVSVLLGGISVYIVCHIVEMFNFHSFVCVFVSFILSMFVYMGVLFLMGNRTALFLKTKIRNKIFNDKS